MSEMSNRHEQDGSAHVIIIVGLVVALVAALGVVFYQNFIGKQATSSTQISSSSANTSTTSEQSKKATVTLKEYCATYEQLCFDMPDNWKVVDLGQPEGATLPYKLDRLEIRTDIDKKVLHLYTGIEGIGGSCPDEDKTTLSTVAVYTTKLTGYADEWSDNTAYAVKAISKGMNGKYSAGMYLTTTKELTDIGNSQNCGFGYTTLIRGKRLNDGYGGHGSISFGSIGFGSTTTPSEYDTKSLASDSLNTDEMNKAYDILRSAYYK